MIIPKPTKIKLELLSSEIEKIIDELDRMPHSIYVCFDFGKIVEKLKESLKNGK